MQKARMNMMKMTWHSVKRHDGHVYWKPMTTQKISKGRPLDKIRGPSQSHVHGLAIECEVALISSTHAFMPNSIHVCQAILVTIVLVIFKHTSTTSWKRCFNCQSLKEDVKINQDIIQYNDKSLMFVIVCKIWAKNKQHGLFFSKSHN